MGIYRFGAVEVVFAGNAWDQNEILLGSLVRAGFGKILRVKDLDRLPERLHNSTPDLVILQSDPADTAPLDLCHGLRHNLIGHNPFATVLEWNSRPTEAIVQKAAQCGIDGVISDPPSAPRIIHSVARFIENRRPFVVTSDYIGPDRRSDDERSGDELLIEVPNALKTKATGNNLAIARLKGDIAAAVRQVDTQRSACHVERIAYLVAMIEWTSQPKNAGPVGVDREAQDRHLEALVQVANDLAPRVQGARSEIAADHCRTLSALASRMREIALDGESVELDQIRRLARDIANTCRPYRAAANRPAPDKTALGR